MHARTRLLAVVSALFAMGAGPAPERVQVPFERSLEDTQHHTWVLDRADVVIRIDDTRPAMLRARLPESARRHSVFFEVQQADGRFALRRPPAPTGDEAPRPTVLLEAVVGSGTNLDLASHGGALTLDGAPSDAARQRAPRAIPEPGTLPAAPWRLDLRDSQARLVGIEHAEVTAAGGVVQLLDTTGAVRLQVDGGAVESEGHVGYLHLDLVDTEAEVRALTGALDFNLGGGQLEAFEIGEVIQGRAAGGFVVLEGWRGRASLHGETTRMTVRRGGDEARLDIGGRSIDANVDDHGGPLVAELDGGALRANTVFGPVTATGRAQATIAVSYTEERVDLTLEQANGSALGIPTTAYFEVTDGRIEADDVGRFAARGENAEATVRGVRRLDIVSFKNSTIDLDLTDIRHHPAIALHAATEARIRMPMPCLVRVAASTFAVENKVRVDGCRFMHPGNMPPREQRLPREGERSLVVNVVDEGSLDVEGVVLD